MKSPVDDIKEHIHLVRRYSVENMNTLTVFARGTHGAAILSQYCHGKGSSYNSQLEILNSLKYFFKYARELEIE